ncbi:MAG: hypothetical protein ABL964_00555 [Steroidobacteraceae bacterium]
MALSPGARVWGRALAVWALIALTESVHGTLRQLFLAPVIGDFRARQVSVFTGSALILLVAYLLIRWIGAIRTWTLLRIGLLWLFLTLIFEVSLGRALGIDWQRILADYDVTRGGLMLVGMVVLLLAPLVAARMRGTWRSGAQTPR